MSDKRFEFKPTESNPSGSSSAREIHKFDDVDFERTSHHHTLGTGPLQAAPGNHKHLTMMEGITLTGAKGGNVALANLITMLADHFGFTDGTT